MGEQISRDNRVNVIDTLSSVRYPQPSEFKELATKFRFLSPAFYYRFTEISNRIHYEDDDVYLINAFLVPIIKEGLSTHFDYDEKKFQYCYLEKEHRFERCLSSRSGLKEYFPDLPEEELDDLWYEYNIFRNYIDSRENKTLIFAGMHKGKSNWFEREVTPDYKPEMKFLQSIYRFSNLEFKSFSVQQRKQILKCHMIKVFLENFITNFN